TTIFGPVATWYVNDILSAAPPPPGVLPAGVRRARPLAFKTGTSYGFRDACGPKILCPPDGATVEWHGEGVPLEASGGRAPLRWLADGKPLPADRPRRTLYWTPRGVGFAQLTVIDANGRSARATVRLSP